MTCSIRLVDNDEGGPSARIGEKTARFELGEGGRYRVSHDREGEATADNRRPV
jgi:hypothetical protein